MTHVLDWPIEFVAMVVAKAEGHGKLKMVEEWGAVLRILRAEREGRRDCESVRNYAIGEGMAIGQLNERRKAMEWLHRRGLHSEAWDLEKCKHLSRILKPSDRADELRAEGRREAEEVFAETLERTRREVQRAGEVATDGIERAAWPIVEGVLQRIVHHIKEGTFWRMYEGRDHESEEYERVVSEGQRDEVMREQGRAEERCHATGFLNELMEELSEEPRAQVVVDVIRRRLLQGDHWRGGEG